MFVLINLDDWIRDQGGCLSILEYIEPSKTSHTNWFKPVQTGSSTNWFSGNQQPTKSNSSSLSKTSFAYASVSSSNGGYVFGRKTYAVTLLLVVVVPVVLSALVYELYSRHSNLLNEW